MKMETVFCNVCTLKLGADESPKRKDTTFTTSRQFEIKINHNLQFILILFCKCVVLNNYKQLSLSLTPLKQVHVCKEHLKEQQDSLHFTISINTGTYSTKRRRWYL
jgi:hypothetical protein